MYPNMNNVCTKFEQKQKKHIQDTSFSKNQDGRQSAIFDPIWGQIVMDMCPNMYNICIKSEQNLTKHVQDTTHFQKTSSSQSAIFDLIVK